MEEQIKRIVKSQKVQYISFWIIPLLLVLLGEAGVLPVGIKADNVRAVYVFETVGILMTAPLECKGTKSVISTVPKVQLSFRRIIISRNCLSANMSLCDPSIYCLSTKRE